MAVTTNTDGNIVTMTAAADVISGKIRVSAIRFENGVTAGDTTEIRSGSAGTTDRVCTLYCAIAGQPDVMFFPNQQFENLKVQSLSSGRVLVYLTPSWM